ncbi:MULTISPECIES: hypothetical protein [unclassified Burkholderia]|uniref:hypothetical protein n=1 Tax=unclassified Burkholderia TaxID=2613784 RepID=UPI000F57EA6C|nr:MULTISPECIES: hypothetical protein [unclassified Burkholderia]RQR87707.1 hypothetical protein DIE10_06370 [Burkholderia sp. Bp9011]RQR97051.1 hypothetical protein DIE09_06545 [Burkholderia sp. Bp9010]
MSALINTIRMLSGRLALLRAERERYQALCAAAYQLAGAMNAPVRFLDAFSDGANGEIEVRQKTEDLLPVDPKEMGEFPAWSDAEVEAWKRDAERYRWAIALEDNAETLYGAVISCGPSAKESINIEVDMARGAK